MNLSKTDWLIGAMLLCGVVLRIALFWVNPAGNAFDNHFEPITLILNNGVPAGKFDCFQCYHPPTFYTISALVAKALFAIGWSTDGVMKGLQFLNCLYGVATLWVVLLILRRLPISDFARVLAFGTLCFLPRHIYMGALHSNDTLSYLLVVTSIFQLMRVLDGKRSWRNLSLLSALVSAAIFTKYTAFSLLPVLASSLALLLLRGEKWRGVARMAAVVLAVPTILLAAYMVDNQQRYGAALPFNAVLYDPTHVQPRDPGGIDFFSFAPSRFVEKPILWPGQVSSFWTLLHASMWFDIETKFLPLVAEERFRGTWWNVYGLWLRGEVAAPRAYEHEGGLVRTTGSMLIALGLVPLLIGAGGGLITVWKMGQAVAKRDWSQASSIQILLLLLFVLNVAGIIKLALGMPVFSAMKASYLLSSMPSMAAFLALGLMTLERHRLFRSACYAVFGLLFALVGLNTLAIVVTFV